MKKLPIVLLLAGLLSGGCTWFGRNAPAPPAGEVVLSGDESWSSRTPHSQIGVTGRGSLDNPYVYTMPAGLNLVGHTIRIVGGMGIGSLGTGPSAVLNVAGNVSGEGVIDIASQGRRGGNIQVNATGGIALRELASPGGSSRGGGQIQLAAAGPVTIAGYLNSAGDRGPGEIIISGSSISVGQCNGYSLAACGSGGKGLAGGRITLTSPGSINLAGGLYAPAGSSGSAGSVFIHGGGPAAVGGLTPGGPALPPRRAGHVTIGGDVNISGAKAGRGQFFVASESLLLAGNILAQGDKGAGGQVDVESAGDCRIRGYVRTDSAAASAGHVRLTGRHLFIEGMDVFGRSVWARPASAAGCQVGDADVRLTGADSATASYDQNAPLEGGTSSIFVIGKIVTGYAGSKVRGEVDIAAVEVDLGGDVLAELAKERTVEIHFGSLAHGIGTHLVEATVRWDGKSEHNIRYGAAAPTFIADVPYAGLSRKPPSPR